MITRIGEWIELSFWQLLVRVLSGARPLSHGLVKAQQSIETQPLTRFLPNGWFIALSGWLLGLALGIALAIWWL